MKRNFLKRVMALSLVAAMLAAFAGCSYLLPAEEEALEPPLVATKEVTYTTVKVTRGDLAKVVNGDGTFYSSNTEEVSFPASGGRLAKIVAKYGSDVKKGDVLLELTADDIQYQLDGAKIRYDIQTASYAQMKKQGANAYSLKMQNYQVQLAKLELDHLQQQLDSTKLLSPIDGKITYMGDMKAGDVLEAFKSYMTVSDPTKLLLAVVGDTSYNFVTGRDVTVKIGDQTFKGKVLQNPNDKPTSLGGQKEDQAYAVIDVYDVPAELKTLGRDATVTMIAESRQNVLILPSNVVRDYNSRTYVQVLEDGVKVEKDVVLGLKAGTQYEIVSGVEEGEEVIVS
jgi:macrolide-specific efflux system membrane fusion protein